MLSQFYEGKNLEIFSLLESVTRLSGAKFKMAAVIVRGNKVLGFGPNKMNRGFKAVRENKYPWPVEHCELAAIRDALMKQGVKLNGDLPLGKALQICRGTTLYVFRQWRWKNGHPAMARPCPRCMEVLVKLLGFKKVVYTTSEFPYFQEEEVP